MAREIPFAKTPESTASPAPLRNGLRRIFALFSSRTKRRENEAPSVPEEGKTRVNFRRKIDATIDSKQLESLRVFHEVASALTSNLELDPLLRAILHKMEDHFGPEQWSLMMVDDDKQELYYAITAGVDEFATRNVRIPIGEGIAGYVARTGTPLVVPDVNSDPDWARFAASQPDLNLQSIACLPIRFGDNVLGVLQLHNSKLDLLPDSSLSFLRVMCDYTAIALQNARHVKLIHQLSITDDCTGLFNSRYLYTLLEEEIAAVTNPKVRPLHPYFSLVFLDLDYFKSINDTHGHQVGSRLLAEIGSLLKRVLGPNHSGFRYGGDEFVALLRGMDKPAAKAFAEDLLAQLNAARFNSAQGLSLQISASLGVATFPQHGDTLQNIVRSADTMMYLAKSNGRNRVEVADSDNPGDMPMPKSSRHS